jgi:uncharacterized damage-inducible protein DinB
MPTANEIIAHSLSASQMLMKRFVEDLQPQEYLHRPAAKANCAAWLLGHLVLTERRTLAALGATDLPALPDGFEQRFGKDGAAPQQNEFGDTSILFPLWERHRSLLIEKLRGATPEQLDKPAAKPHPMFSTVGQMINFMAQHATLHAGQISTIRRSLGRPPII